MSSYNQKNLVYTLCTYFQKNSILHVQSGMNAVCMSDTYPSAPGLSLLSSFKEKSIRSDNELAPAATVKESY